MDTFYDKLNNSKNEKENAKIWNEHFGNNIFGRCEFCEMKYPILIDKQSKRILNIKEKTLKYKYIPSAKYLKINKTSTEILPVCFYCYDQWENLNTELNQEIHLEKLFVEMNYEDNYSFSKYVNDYLKFSGLCNYYDTEKSTYCCKYIDDDNCDQCMEHYKINKL
jgi:hypothetical protein